MDSSTNQKRDFTVFSRSADNKTKVQKSPLNTGLLIFSRNIVYQQRYCQEALMIKINPQEYAFLYLTSFVALNSKRLNIQRKFISNAQKHQISLGLKTIIVFDTSSYQFIANSIDILIKSLLLKRSITVYFLLSPAFSSRTSFFMYVISGAGRRLIFETLDKTLSASPILSWP